MLQEIRVTQNDAITLPKPIRGVSEGGVMALARTPNLEEYNFDAVIGRGIIRPDSQSCLFVGRLQENALSIERILLHPLYPIDVAQYRPLTDHGEVVWGYEDPTPIDPENNRFEPGKWGCLITEAYHSHRHNGWLDCNTLYYGLETGKIVTALTPDRVLGNGLEAYFDDLNMVKEFQFIRDYELASTIFEVGARKTGAKDRKSRICMASPAAGRMLFGSVKPFLDPDMPNAPGWMKEHTSPAGNPIHINPLVEEEYAYLTVFNARSENCWRITWCVHDSEGNVSRWGEPFISPPPGTDPGPKGQQIAFGSDVNVLDREGPVGPYGRPTRIEVLYHAQDRYPCRAECELIFD